jgi:anti-anti-sigma regulatory factor
MESVIFQKLTNEQGQITNLTISGFLVVEQARQLKKEMVEVLKNINDSVDIEIIEVEDIDISFIQLMVAFTKQLNETGIRFKLKWNLDEDQRVLLENVGLSYELYMND